MNYHQLMEYIHMARHFWPDLPDNTSVVQVEAGTVEAPGVVPNPITLRQVGNFEMGVGLVTTSGQVMLFIRSL